MNRKLQKNNTIARDKAYAEAKEWLFRLNAEPASPETLAGFRDWLDGHPANQAEFNMATEIWESLDVLKDNPLALEELEQDARATQMPPKRPFIERLFGGFPAMRALAAAAAVLFVAAGIWWMQKEAPLSRTYYTITGEQKEAHLSDGSTLHLDTKTMLAVSFTQAQRRIELIEGRASFSVAKDADRPFVVHAGNVSIRAIGTVFNVYKKSHEKVSVAVTEGKVRISENEEPVLPQSALKEGLSQEKKKPAENQDPIPLLKAAPIQEIVVSGQEATIDGAKAICAIKPLDMAETNKWRDGKLVFHDRPLEEVIREINRYLDQKIIIDDERLSELNVTLSFLVKHRENFLSALKSLVPIDSRPTLNGHVIIKMKKRPNPVSLPGQKA